MGSQVISRADDLLLVSTLAKSIRGRTNVKTPGQGSNKSKNPTDALSHLLWLYSVYDHLYQFFPPCRFHDEPGEGALHGCAFKRVQHVLDPLHVVRLPAAGSLQEGEAHQQLRIGNADESEETRCMTFRLRYQKILNWPLAVNYKYWDISYR